MIVNSSFKILIVTILTLTVNTVIAKEKTFDKWRLHNNNTGHSDYLTYKLKYSGFISLFIWKELADVVFISKTQSEDFEGNPICQLEMKLSTENYSFSESLHPYRYKWRSKVSADLAKIYLVEEIGKGTDEEYNVQWLDWQANTIDLFRQRQMIFPEIDVHGEEEEYLNPFDVKEEPPAPYWEKDGDKPVPAYFNYLPKIENEHNFLVYDKSIEIDQLSSLIDPLAMLYSARWYNKTEHDQQTFNVFHKDEINEYRIEIMGEEILNVGEQEISTTKVNVMRKNVTEAEDEGFIILWVSNDARRLPLKYEVQVKIGTIHLDLTEKSLQTAKHAKSCLSVASESIR